MSIKNLFDKSRQGSRNYSDYSTDKDTFDEVESSRNAASIQEEKRTYIPQVDYSDPKNFVKFGSAELYYSGALNRIADYYPYDGSDAEKNEFYNNLFDGEKYIFDNLYPRYNGFAILGADGVTYTSMTSDGYGRPAAASTEYISFKGGPGSGSGGDLSTLSPNPFNNKKQVSNIYDKTIYQSAGLPSDYGTGTRESNLKSNFDTGVTVEFWLKKDSFAVGSSEKEVVFDMWNNELSSSTAYGRLTIELTGAASGSPFVITAQSGTVSASIFVDSIGSAPTTGSLSSWHHYAFRFYNSGSNFVTKLYVDGRIDDTNTYTSKKLGEITTSAMLGRIGALMTSPSGSSAIAGDGTLSASVDDFRFWKTNRNSRQIGTSYFVSVGGGANTDISNADLGVYYKFNEGITADSTVDSIVLDYAGRVTNAIWTGYDTSSRNTGSAIVLAGAAEKEYREPVVRRNNPAFIDLQTNLQSTGSAYDTVNNASFMNYAPSWVLSAHDETENKNLKNLSHIAGTYFDKLYLLGQELPKIRHLNYTTASSSPVPFASHLPTSMGLYVPELFIDASILERLTDRTDTELFESKLNEIKNLIYLNLYNNVTNIYKSKGTEKSIRNVFRCFNIDDSLIKMNVYNKGATYEVKTNLKQSVIEKSTINFNTRDNVKAVVYQAQDSTNTESRGYISGSTGDGTTGPEQYNGATIESDIMFPRFFVNKDKFDRDFTDISLFGLHTVDTGSAGSLNGTDTTLLAGGVDYANFQVFAVRDAPYSDNVYFKLTSSNSPFPLPELTSSVFFDVYDESRWNISIRVKPKDYPNAGMVSGSLSNTYDVVFRGINTDLGVIKNSFELTGTISNAVGSAFLRAPKRIYVGARRENITGSLLEKSDVQALSCRYWTKYIDDNSLNMHAHGEENVGITDTYRNIQPIDPFLNSAADLTNRNTLALSWNFDNVTSSDAGGSFTVEDYSSGSYSLREDYGWLGKITGYQHDGKGFGFANSSTTVANTERINSFSFVDPEQAVSSNMINILSDDDEVLEFYETLPNYVFTVEKSMYSAISEEMINFFAGAVDFNNVIGEPVNRYRSRYKGLEKLREAFFERVTTTSEVEKFVEYYKWFDDAISTIIAQLVPASADFVDDVLNIVESHALERNKYETKFPTLEAKDPVIEGATKSVVEKEYLYRLGSSTVPRSPRDTTKHSIYWKRRAERTAAEITSGDSTVDNQREIYRRVINSNPYLSRSVSTLFDSTTSTGYLADTFARRNFIKNFSDKVERSSVIKGGVNFDDNKNIHFVYSSLLPAGPINTEGGRIVPLNVLLSFMSDLVATQPDNDPKLATEKIKRYTKVLSGRDYEGGVGYKNMKSSIAFPFNIISGSVSTGYQKEVAERLSASIILTNLHNDVYGPDMEVPMQGPFTNYAVGGHQSRHVRINEGTDSWLNRPEAWKILLGTCTDIPSGAIGMVGPDYPNNSDYLTPNPYPDTRVEKAVYFRDHIAKRPVNIRNIHMTTGSTILGNYRETYQYVQAPGAYNNPRHFVDQQPDLPSRVFVNNATSSMFTRTFLDMHRTSDGHTQNVAEYNTGYLDGAINKSVIISRFSAPGGIEVSTRGYQDFRASEFSVYNGLNNRNLSVIKPWQGPSGTISTPAVNGDTTDIQVFDIHEKDYGLYSHLARHTARFGRDSLFESNPGASYEELPGFHKVHRNNLNRKEVVSTSIVPISSGYQQPITHYTEVSTAGDRNVYDNFNVQHQIPRSSKQYAWITASLVRDNGWVGFTPKDFLVKQSDIGLSGDEFVEVYDFVSGSEVGSALVSSSVSFLNGKRTFGWPVEAVSALAALSGYHPQVSHLNTNIYEPIDSASTNTVGYPSTVPLTAPNDEDLSYLNDHSDGDRFLYGNSATSDYNAAEIFNNLMFKRGNQYGFPSWKQLRQADNPVLRNQRATNTLTVVGPRGDDDVLVTYDLPPVSNRAKPNIISFMVGNNSQPHTFKVTDENERVYYNSPEMDNRFAPSFNSFMTPSEQVLGIARSGQNRINWIVYSQQLFPSIKNEFVSSSTDKVGYDNLFWRDSRTARNTVNTVLDRADTTAGSRTAENGFGIYVSQSSWMLDAPADFQTRETCFHMDNTASFARYASASAGQLQNVYMGIMTGSYVVTEMDTNGPEVGALNWINYYGLGPLYARKHVLQTAPSVKSPYGPGLPYTDLSGGLTEAIVSASFNYSDDSDNRWIKIGAGEANWEAPTQAGYYKQDVSGNLEFISAPSNPWFTDYIAFRQDLKLKAKGFSVIPEFRISEHIDDYITDGDTPNRYAGLNLEIPHVSGATSEEDPTFFTTYTNSEFLKDFLRIKNTSLLNATEIRISCTGAIRFNPYKGFYPAQRTVQMVEEFKDSYQNNMIYGTTDSTTQTSATPGTGSGEILYPAKGGVQNTHESRHLKPLSDALFSPGILFNTVKSGIAVDYPIVLDANKLSFADVGRKTDTDPTSGSWATTVSNKYQIATQGDTRLQPGYSFFDDRLPFETMLEPEKHLVGKSFFDMESNPFNQTRFATASFVKNDSKDDYKRMANNFFGSVPSFFLKDEEFTSIKSTLNTETFKFKGDETYMMRVVLERSTEGPRTYENEVDGHGRSYTVSSEAGNAYSLYGGRPILDTGASSGGSTPSTTAGHPTLKTGSYTGSSGITGSAYPGDYFEIPQDPLYNLDFKETFTMYSRPSAFGPDLTGRSATTLAYARNSEGAVDSFIGVNPGYTPPYTNGEAWADLIFRPSGSVSYTLRDIMAETQIVCWRFDAGPVSVTTGSLGALTAYTNTMIYDVSNHRDGALPISYLPYGGGLINNSAMQLTSSFNLFGIEKQEFVETDKFGNVSSTRPGTTVGERWVIRSKFETPMLNFSGSSVTYPTNFGGESTPRGMWHQFGKIPQQKEGVFISVQDVPANWLKNHYLVKDYKSIYNNEATNGVENYQKKVLSLADLVGFNTKTKEKVGKLKEKTVLREAVVAIPYIVEQVKTDASQRSGNEYRKSFIEIPKQRFEAAKKEAYGSQIGDSFDAAGASVSKQLQKMDRYVFPPQFDFLNNPQGAADPFVMYIFEFEYELDKDDLSYIWQNLAPRDYQRMELQHESVAHELLDAELLNEETLEENQQLRWMVFKVKQKGQDSYWDKTDTQVGKNATDIQIKNLQKNQSQKNDYQFSHNWPYDYVSFVEMVKINSEIKFSDRPELLRIRNYRAFYDLTQSKPGSLKLEKMLKSIKPAYLTNPLKLEYNPLASLKGAALAQAEADLATRKAQKASRRASVPTTVQVAPAPRARGRSVRTSTTAPSAQTATTEATEMATPVGGRADTDSNSGGGSTY